MADGTWVEVTKPMLACGSSNDYADGAKLPDMVLQTLIAPPGTARPEDCFDLKVGQKLMLDDQPDRPDTDWIIKMWAPNCQTGCVPYMDVVYAPPRRIVGAYLQPTTAP